MDIISLIVFVIIIIIGASYLIYNILKKPRDVVKQNELIKKKNDKNQVSDELLGYKKNTTDVQRKDLFGFIEFDKISDNMIISEKESKYTMVIQCKGINYDLMSEVEQLSVEEGFITFLNTLKSPIQLYVQARAVNLKNSLELYKKRVGDINREYEEKNESFKKLSDDINSTPADINKAQIEKEKFSNISEYAEDITKYVEKLSLNKHMLQRKFYVILSYYKSEVTASADFSKKEIYDICYRELYTRSQSIIGALQACSVNSRILNSNELAELLYISYNRDDENLIDIKTALESGFYRLYSTSEDLMDKKNELLDKEIKTEAMNRVEKAIKIAIDTGMIKPDGTNIEQYENDVDTEAVKIIEATNIPDENKKDIQQIIIDKHNYGVEQRVKERIKKHKKIKDEEVEENKSDNNILDVAEKKEIIKEEIVNDEAEEKINSTKGENDSIV
ncbi:MAG: hypothetical protein RSE41_02785 [Clostridia bacterium]